MSPTKKTTQGYRASLKPTRVGLFVLHCIQTKSAYGTTQDSTSLEQRSVAYHSTAHHITSQHNTTQHTYLLFRKSGIYNIDYTINR